MTFRAKLPYIISTILIVIISSWLMSNNTPFTGDEFYTLDIENIHKPIPYRMIVAEVIEHLRPITPGNIFSLRFTSILFTLISVMLFYIYLIRDKYEMIVFSILIITSSFLLIENIFFRYYTYYFLTSTLTYLLLVHCVRKWTINQKLIFSFIGILISPYIFFILNTMQFAFYFMYVLIFEKIKNSKTRIILSGILTIFTIYALFNPTMIWFILEYINLSGHAKIDMDSSNIRGFTLSILLKPFFAIYQMFFGLNVAPSESYFIIILFFIILSLIIYVSHEIFLQDKNLFILYSIIGLFPFLFLYYFLEVLSLPGFTQLQSNHGIFLFPILLVLIVKTSKYIAPIKSYFFIGVVFISQLIGINSTYRKNNTDWNLITHKINNYLNYENNQMILMDGRSIGEFNFYNQNQEINKLINYTWEPIDSLASRIKDKERLVLLLNDYKSYTPLTIEQNWNSGSTSLGKVEKLNMILNILNKEFYLDGSYINYPTFLYLFKKKNDNTDNYFSAGVWEHHLKDLELPIKKDKKKEILSSVILYPGDSVEVNTDSIIVFNLEESENITYGDTVGNIFMDEKVVRLIKGENIWDVFSEFHDATINNDKIFHSWYHTPLVSGSIKYNGSYYKHNAHIYFLDLENKIDHRINVLNTSKTASIRIWN